MATVVRPFIALHSAIDDVVRHSADYVEAVRSEDLQRVRTEYAGLEAAVEVCARARAAHIASTDGSSGPILQVICGGLVS